MTDYAIITRGDRLMPNTLSAKISLTDVEPVKSLCAVIGEMMNDNAVPIAYKERIAKILERSENRE